MTAQTTHEPHERFVQQRHFGSLDSLRALAVLAVVWHHTGAQAYTSGILKRGYLGVEFFFVISGMLITTLLLRERDRHGDISLKDFTMRRVLRIFPLYYTTLLIYALAVAFFETDQAAADGFWQNLPAFATYTFNWFLDTDPEKERVIFYFAWSLSAEEQFYLVWPQVLKRSGVRGARNGVIALTGAVFVAHLTIWRDSGYDSPLAERMLRSIPFAILLGVVIAFALHAPSTYRRLWGIFSHPLAAPASVVATLALLVSDDLAGVWVSLGFGAIVIATTITEHHGLRHLTSSRVLIRIGAVSYGIYLLHGLVIQGIEKIVGEDLDPRVMFVLASIGVFIVAQLSFTHFESRFLALKSRFAR